MKYPILVGSAVTPLLWRRGFPKPPTGRVDVPSSYYKNYKNTLNVATYLNIKVVYEDREDTNFGSIEVGDFVMLFD